MTYMNVLSVVVGGFGRKGKLNMNKPIQWTVWGALAMMTAATFSPGALADDASRQKNKNDWRNLATAGAVVAGYGLVKHNKTATVVGAAGAGYGAYRYEKDRHSQAQTKRARQYYSRHDKDYESYRRRSSRPSTTYVHSTRTTRRYGHVIHHRGSTSAYRSNR